MRRGRTMRRSKGKRGSTVRSHAKVHRKSSKVKKGKKSKRGMNAFMKAKEKARKAGDDTFTYNGSTYKKATTKTGMVIYKKA